MPIKYDRMWHRRWYILMERINRKHAQKIIKIIIITGRWRIFTFFEQSKIQLHLHLCVTLRNAKRTPNVILFRIKILSRPLPITIETSTYRLLIVQCTVRVHTFLVYMQVARAHKLLSSYLSWDALNVYFAMHPYNLVHCAIVPPIASSRLEVSAKCIRTVQRPGLCRWIHTFMPFDCMMHSKGNKQVKMITFFVVHLDRWNECAPSFQIMQWSGYLQVPMLNYSAENSLCVYRTIVS